MALAMQNVSQSACMAFGEANTAGRQGGSGGRRRRRLFGRRITQPAVQPASWPILPLETLARPSDCLELRSEAPLTSSRQRRQVRGGKRCRPGLVPLSSGFHCNMLMASVVA